jgi:hypothetical protein
MLNSSTRGTTQKIATRFYRYLRQALYSFRIELKSLDYPESSNLSEKEFTWP